MGIFVACMHLWGAQMIMCITYVYIYSLYLGPAYSPLFLLGPYPPAPLARSLYSVSPSLSLNRSAVLCRSLFGSRCLRSRLYSRGTCRCALWIAVDEIYIYYCLPCCKNNNQNRKRCCWCPQTDYTLACHITRSLARLLAHTGIAYLIGIMDYVPCL